MNHSLSYLLILLLIMAITLLIVLKLCLETDYMCCLRQFLYPSEEDLYKLIRFLVERLSELSEDRRIADVKDNNDRRRIKEDDLKSSSTELPEKADNEGIDSCEKVGAKLKDLKLKTEVPELSNSKAEDSSSGRHHEADLIPQKMDKKAVDEIFCSRTGDFSKDVLTSTISAKDSTEKVMDAGRDTSGNEETSAWRNDKDVVVFEQEGTFREQSLKVLLFELM
jgi:hypothetical protein